MVGGPFGTVRFDGSQGLADGVDDDGVFVAVLGRGQQLVGELGGARAGQLLLLHHHCCCPHHLHLPLLAPGL